PPPESVYHQSHCHVVLKSCCSIAPLSSSSNVFQSSSHQVFQSSSPNVIESSSNKNILPSIFPSVFTSSACSPPKGGSRSLHYQSHRFIVSWSPIVMRSSSHQINYL